MSKFYKFPILLIEFHPEKAFSLQSSDDLTSEINQTNIVSKLSLLAIAFPQLKIIWSRSPHATSDIFNSLKVSHKQPDVNRAIAYGGGGSSSHGGNNDDDGITAEARAKDDARNILLSLPGVTPQNFRNLVTPTTGGAKDLAELSTLSLPQLTTLIGAAAGKKLHTFFIQNDN